MSGVWEVVFSERLGALTPEKRALADSHPAHVSTAGLTSAAEITANAAEADILVLGAVEPMTRAVIESLPRLKAIVRQGIGVDNVDLEAATDHGIPVAFVPAATVEEVSDHALALALGLARELPGIAAAVQAGGIADAAALGNRTRRFSETTLGVVGFGRIGRALARKAASVFGTVIAADPMLERGSRVERVEIVALDELWQRADIISLHAPSLPGAAPLIDASSLARMREGVLLVNTARGQLIDEDALVHAVGSGRVAGAALDVTAVEPLPPGSPLLGHPRILLTGHTASKGRLAAITLQRTVLAAVEALLDHRVPEHIANPAVLGSAHYRPPLAGDAKGNPA